jgi:hypothetical protein
VNFVLAAKTDSVGKSGSAAAFAVEKGTRADGKLKSL